MWLKVNSSSADPELCQLSTRLCLPMRRGWGETALTPAVPALRSSSLFLAPCSANSQLSRRALDEDKTTVSFAVNHFCGSSVHPHKWWVQSLRFSKPKASLHPWALLHPGSAVLLPSSSAAWCIPKLVPSDGEKPGHLNPSPYVGFSTRMGTWSAWGEVYISLV